MNITCLTHTSAMYGANLSMMGWISECLDRAHTFHIVAPEGPIHDLARSYGIRTTVFQVPWLFSPQCAKNRLRLAKSIVWTCVGHRQLISRIRETPPSLIYSNSAVIPTGAILGKRIQCPHVWHLREFLDLDFNLNPTLGWGPTRWLFAKAQAVISVSKAVQAHLCSPSAANSHVVYEGVASSKELRRRNIAAKERITKRDKVNFIIVGMIQSNKGQSLAVRALAKLKQTAPAVSLTIVGGGDQSELRLLANELGIHDSVFFTGHVDNPGIFFSESDASLMLSKAEAFGRTTIEAMSFGMPVIGVAAGATPELVQHEQNGLLCHADEDSIADCMHRLTADQYLRQKLGHNALSSAAMFTNERYAQEMRAIFRTTLSTKSR